MNEYNFEQVKRLRIHELRDYARTMGVTSPTTMNKNELIDKIEEIFESRNLGLTAGTPNDGIDFFELLKSDDSSVLNKLLAREARVNKQNKKIKYDVDGEKANGPELNLAVAQDESSYVGLEGEVFEGYLDIHPEGYGIVRKHGFVPTNEDVYVTEALIRKKGLKKGLFVRGKAKVIVASKPKIMYEVNYVDIDSQKARINYDECAYSQRTVDLYAMRRKMKFASGERTYIPDMDLDTTIDFASQMASVNRYTTKIVNFNAVPEFVCPEDTLAEVINIPFNVTEIEAVNAIELVIERAKREAEIGKASVVFLYGFSDIIRAFNVAIEGYYDFNRYNARAIGKIKKILYSAKNIDNKHFVNIVCVDANGLASDIKDLAMLELLPLLQTKTIKID